MRRPRLSEPWGTRANQARGIIGPASVHWHQICTRQSRDSRMLSTYACRTAEFLVPRFSRPPLTDSMGRPPWASPEQLIFLQSFLPRLDEEKSGNTLKAFYASVTQEFIKQWRSPIPEDVDTVAITDPVLLKELADARRGRVSFICSLLRSVLTPSFSSRLKTGSRRPDANTQARPLSPNLLSILLARAPGNLPPYNLIKHTRPGTFTKSTHHCATKLKTYGTVAKNRRS